MTCKIPELPYSFDALMPVISPKTMKIHYESHHLGYATKLNNLMVDSRFDSMELSEIVKNATGPIFNNASQTWNHTFFWDCMTVQGTTHPSIELVAKLNEKFESFEKFKSIFSQTAQDLFGSGWVWLLRDNSGELSIESYPNADSPLRLDKKPLLVLDVWEHSYYLDYDNHRAGYIDAWWSIVNWDFVKSNFEDSK